MEITHVIFSYPGRHNIKVPVEEAFAWSDRQPCFWTPSWCHLSTGDGSYCKGWFDPDTGKLVKFGAGAYGDSFQVERPEAVAQ